MTRTTETPYRSNTCRMGQHRTCTEHRPRVTPCEGVKVLACTCACHTPRRPSPAAGQRPSQAPGCR